MERRGVADKTPVVRRLSRWGCSALVVSATCLAVVVGGDRVAAQSAGNGLEERSVNSFEFDPGRGVVRVTIDVDLRNVTTDVVEGDVVRRAFFDGYSVPVPLGAENIVATRDGTVLGGTLISNPDFPAFSAYRVPLDPALFSGDSATLRLTYDHLGAPPRDPVPWRVNEAYAGFVAFGIGDEGLVTLRISQPSGYEFDEFTDLSGFEVGAPDAFGTVIYTQSGLDADTRITVGMADDTRLVSRPLDVDGVELDVRSWPDDPEWADFAAATVGSGIPALAGLIGSPWPVEGSVDVRETVEPTLYGYAGWFDTKTNEIAVGEALDADTIYHELSHAWLNSRLSTERWLTEGLAQVYAAELVRRDGDIPREPPAPEPDDPVAAPLTDWTGFGSERAVEEFGYDTSFWVLDVLVDEIGFQRTSDVVAGLRDRISAYDPAAAGEPTDDDWKRVYDAFVEIGGATTAPDLFRAHVVDAQEADLIGRRDQAAAEVAALGERSSPWQLPVGLRKRLERWEFDDVSAALLAADVVLEQRAELEAIEGRIGIDEPDGAGDAYADAPIGQAGGLDFSGATDVLDTSIALGDELEDRLGDIDALAVRSGVSPPEVSSLAGVEDFASGLDAADDQLRALTGLIDVEEQLDEASGPLAAVGRWGWDPQGDLDTASEQIERGENDAAIATLESTGERIENVETVGALRLAVAVAAIAIILAAVVVIARRRRRPPVRIEVDAI